QYMPGSLVVKPGESFSISCKISQSSYCIHWIRQPAGKAPEWLGYLYLHISQRTKDSVKSKISLSQDTSINTVYLRGQNFQTEDTAVYYCATHTHNDTTMQNSCTKTSSTTHCCPHSLSHTISPACLEYEYINQCIFTLKKKGIITKNIFSFQVVILLYYSIHSVGAVQYSWHCSASALLF
uniref:Ig-like domain-containing protein n=1 Tax=Astyanax mexicanus TaxID=7994 RepID=A0A3B1IV69_ASTMX